MHNIKLTIEYDGTNYIGWQRQKNGDSIQEEIEKAIKLITGDDINLIGSGRTDSGVHARGQVANFITKSNIPSDKFKFAINSKLPKDIVIIDSVEVKDDFHARYSAKGKRYKYLIYNQPIRSPIYRNFAYHVPHPLKYEDMEKTIEYFIGTHDFRTFMASNSSVKNTVRTIYNISLYENKNLIEISIEGNGFLYNMVRIIVGTIVDVGRGRIKTQAIPYIIDSKNRNNAGHTAPSEGLYLEKVYY